METTEALRDEIGIWAAFVHWKDKLATYKELHVKIISDFRILALALPSNPLANPSNQPTPSAAAAAAATAAAAAVENNGSGNTASDGAPAGVANPAVASAATAAPDEQTAVTEVNDDLDVAKLQKLPEGAELNECLAPKVGLQLVSPDLFCEIILIAYMRT